MLDFGGRAAFVTGAIGRGRGLAEAVDLVIATDSGTAHLTSLVRPVISLCGGSPWTRFAPLGRYNVVLSRRYPCSPCWQFVRGCIDCRLNVAGGSINIPAEIELKCNASTVQLAYRCDLVNSGDVSKPSFQGRSK